jgi:phenylacetate-coenzyme A ligase PaaK-like adenylate-forming protein
MELWESLEFGAKALALRTSASKPREEILRTQRCRFESLVRHARENSAFYREKYAAIDDANLQLADLPTTDKSQVMENFDDVLTVADVTRRDVEEFFKNESNLGKHFQDKYAFCHTSGSQGQPLLIVQSKDNIELMFALQVSRGNVQLNAWEAVKHFVTPARLAAVILKPGFYPSASAFAYMPEGARRYIDLLFLSATDDDMVDRIAEFRPTHLTAYASLLHDLARHIENGQLTLQPELRQVVNISERLMPPARKRYAKLFGAPVLDDYAMGECLFLTSGCPTSGGMHVNADWAILEVVDENNEPVPDGEKGAKVLVTNLANYVQPFIRYEVGDIVTMAKQQCDCGSNMPLVERVDGRDSDVFWIRRDGGLRPLQPAVFDHAMARILDAREFQYVQDDYARFRIRIEPLSGATINQEDATNAIREHLSHYDLDGQLQIDVELVDRLAGDGANKFKRMVSKVKPPSGGEGESPERDAARQS